MSNATDLGMLGGLTKGNHSICVGETKEQHSEDSENVFGLRHFRRGKYSAVVKDQRCGGLSSKPWNIGVKAITHQ